MLKKIIYSIILLIAMYEISFSQNTAIELFGEQKYGLNANADFVSDFLHRGLSLSDKKPAIQGGVDYKNYLGFNLGGWASSGYEELPLEIDLYTGYSYSPFEEFRIEIKGTGFLYPHNYSKSTAEAMFGIQYSLVKAKYHYIYNSKDHYVELGAEKYIYDKIWMMLRGGILISKDNLWDFEIKSGYEINNMADVFFKIVHHEKEGLRIAVGAMAVFSLVFGA